MDVRPVLRSPSIADLKRQPSSTSRPSAVFASQILSFQHTRSRSAIDRGSETPKFIVPLRAAHSARGSSNSSSRKRRSNTSQSRKAHPSESRYSNRSYWDKSSRRHDVEVEDLNSEAPPPVLPRQDSSVYPSAMACNATSSPTLPSGTSDPSLSSSPKAAAQVSAATSTRPSLSFPSSNGYISTSTYRTLWTVKALFLAGFGAFYVVSAAIHQVFPESERIATLRVQLLNGAGDTSTPANDLHLVSCVVFASVHLGSLLRMVARALYLKRICVAPVVVVAAAATSSANDTDNDQVQAFDRQDTHNSNDNVNQEDNGSPKKRAATQQLSRLSGKSQLAVHVPQSPLVSYQRLLELDSSAEFEHEYIKLRVVQLALHTCLASSMSGGVSSVSLNQLYAAAIVLSCWAPVSIHVLWMRSDSVHRRLCCMTAVLLLDAVGVVMIPMGLWNPYLEIHNEQERYSPIPKQYNDTWIVNMLLDFQFLGGRKLWRTILSIGFDFNIAMCLQIALPTFDQTSSGSFRQKPTSCTQVGILPSGRVQSNSKIAVGGQGSQTKSYGTTTASSLSLYFQQTVLGRLLQRSRLSLMALVLLSWGLGVLISYLVAVSQSPSGDCLVHTFPWFQSKPSCVLLEINCQTGEQLQQQQDLTSLLKPHDFDDSALQYLVISSCDKLEITTRLRDFQGLFGLKIRDSSITTWDSDASLSSLYHPKLRSLSFVRVSTVAQSTSISLEDSENPIEALTVFQICDSNVTGLSPTSSQNIYSSWRSLAFLYLENSNLAEFPAPEVIRGLPLVDFSLSRNSIFEVPKEFFFENGNNTELKRLWLNGNPISELPRDDGKTQGFQLTLLSMGSTDLSSLPAWLSSEFARRTSVFLGGTPLCTASERLVVFESSGFPAASCTTQRASSCS